MIGTDRELDLKVRQWYGHYPTQLVVDEIVRLTINRAPPSQPMFHESHGVAGDHC